MEGLNKIERDIGRMEADIDSMKTDIREIRDDNKAIKKDIDEIKTTIVQASSSAKTATRIIIGLSAFIGAAVGFGIKFLTVFFK